MQVPPPPSPPVPFIGSDEAIRRNDALIAALEIAPNVLFDRYNQFGQVSWIYKHARRLGLCFSIYLLRDCGLPRVSLR